MNATVIFPFSNGASVNTRVVGSTTEKTPETSSHATASSTGSSVGFRSRSFTSAGAPPSEAAAAGASSTGASSATNVAGYQNSPRMSCVNDTEPRVVPATSGEYVTSYAPEPFAGSVSVGAPRSPCPSHRARKTAGVSSGLAKVKRAVAATRTGARRRNVEPVSPERSTRFSSVISPSMSIFSG